MTVTSTFTTADLARRPGPFRDGWVLACQLVEGLTAEERLVVARDLREQHDRLAHNSREQQQFSGALAYLAGAAA